MDMKSKIRKLFVEKETLVEDAFTDEVANKRSAVDGSSLSNNDKLRTVSRLNAAEKLWKTGDKEKAQAYLTQASEILGTSVKGAKTPIKPTVAAHDDMVTRPEKQMSDLGPLGTKATNRDESKVLDVDNLFKNIDANFQRINQGENVVKSNLKKIDAREGTTNLSRFMFDYMKLKNDIDELKREWETKKTREMTREEALEFYNRVDNISGALAIRFGNSFYRVKNAVPNALTGEIWNYSAKTAPSDQAISGQAAMGAGAMGNDNELVVLDPHDPEFGNDKFGNAKKNSVV